MKISDVNIFCPDQRFRFGSVIFDEGGIKAVDAEAEKEESADYLLPGFIDVHIHGTGGTDFLEGRNALLNASRLLPSNGVTTFLPTFAAAADTIISGAVSSLRGFEYPGAEPHSFHLEGPYISPAQKGAQNPEWMRKPSIEEVRKYTELSGGKLSYVTVAPEIEGAEEFVRYCAEEGIRVSVGHTDASYETTLKSFEWGITIANHTFNQMGLFHHRKPAAVGAVLVESGLYCELIADRVHVSEGAIRLLMKTRNMDRLILITDAIAAQNLGDGDYSAGAFNFSVRNGIAEMSDGTLAGSTVTMDSTLRNMLSMLPVKVEDVIPSLTINPARALGLDDRGSIERGKRADFVLADRSLHVISTYVRGKKVYQR